MSDNVVSKALLRLACFGAALAVQGAAVVSAQDITIGVSIATTGPAAALGVPQKTTLGFWPEEIAGRKLKVIQLDDGGDPSAATTNARRLVTENNVDVLIGSSTTPPSMAINGVATEAGVPHFALAPAVFAGDKAKWSVVVAQPVSLMASQIFADMEKRKVKTVGLIGFSDSWGDLWAKSFKDIAEPKGMKLVEDVRYARADTSVAGQVLKLVAAQPDAVLVAASGTGAALPQVALKERGYAGNVYQTHGAASNDFLRIAAAAAEGVVLPAGPVLVAELQADTALTKKPGLAFAAAYEAKNGPASRNLFGAYIYDVAKVLERTVPVALKAGQPGTPAFRDALRAAVETERDIAGSHGVYNFTAADRNGVDKRAAVLITVKGGKWAVVE
ncbi:MAG: ABC transporter substrate-binding protein [Hyphomicrobiaceae bacterium]|nr:ABC transporter substrate-binding protein [Hyphomicrobiaceae bacterium]